jgi:hypothetical protein
VNNHPYGRPPPGEAAPNPFEPASEHDHRRRVLEGLVDVPPPVPLPPARASPPPKRVRVVLAERKRARRVVRTLAEVEEQTGVGEKLMRQLIRDQLGASVWLGLFVAATIGALPLVFVYVPTLGNLSLFGFRLPWVVLGFAVYPFMFGVGWLYVRLADRNEQNFIENVVED